MPHEPPDFPLFRRDADSAPGWQRLHQKSLLHSPFLQVEEITYRTPSHSAGDLRWTVVRRKNAVIVAPRLPDGRFLLIHQERYPVQRTLWEFPAGQIDDIHGSANPEVICATAARELQEETGYALDPVAGRLTPLGYYFSSQGFTDEHAYLFVADGLVAAPVDRLGEGDENIHEVRAFSADELVTMIADNTIADANTLVLFARMKATGIL